MLVVITFSFRPASADNGLNVDPGAAQENKKRPNHALFISYGPYEKPEITTTVVIPFGYTSSNAASTAKDIYEYYFANDKTKAKMEKNNKSVTETNVGTAGD